MATCFAAQLSVALGAAAASSGIPASFTRSGGDAFSSTCFVPSTRAEVSRSALSCGLSCGKVMTMACLKGRIASLKRVALSWSSFNSNRSLSPLLLTRAKRKSGTGANVSQLEKEAEEEEEEELDEDMQVGLNEISTEALKAMLAEDDKEVAQVREKVEYLGKYLVQENQLDAARFMLILRGMLDHEVVPEKDDLKGAYKKAFDTIASVIEDSGWVLKQEGADVGGVEMVDDELMPPVLNSQY